MADKIKVLIVDDASFMVKAVREILETDPQVEVVGSARNGAEALEKIPELKPDVITLDVDMPIMDGIRTVRHVMIKSPVPIVMLSSLFSHGDITFEALRLGVVDFVPKPSGAVSQDIEDARHQVIERVKIAASVHMENVHRIKLTPVGSRDGLTDRYRYQSLDFLIAVGTTLGGPNTVINLMSQLPPDLPAAVVVEQEIDSKILPAFVERFNEYTPWRVEVAEEGMVLEQGTCYISSYTNPCHLILNDKNEACLVAGTDERPLDTLFSSASDIFASHTIGVLLTGVGDDGYEGFMRIKEKDGVTLAQDAKTCVYPNLTQCAIEKGTVDNVVDVNDLADNIAEVISNRMQESDGL